MVAVMQRIQDAQEELIKVKNENIQLREQIKEMQLFLDKANEQLTESNFSNVMRSLQEKKKLWIEKLAEDEKESKFNHLGDEHKLVNEYYRGCIRRDEMIIETLEEIINQNFA